MSEFTAKKIKEARVRAGITQDEAATLIKIKKSTISDIESAKRNITADELAQFSRIYNVDVRELLFVDFTAKGEENARCNMARKAAIYACVSTEHETQISALENQVQYYDELLQRHPDWELVDRYID